MNLQWARRCPGSTNNFDLVLTNPQDLDAERMNHLLDAITRERHRNQTLSYRAHDELRRWLREPDTPLKSDAYVLLSNWFMTRSGDRHSVVATRCEALWDALFASRPVERLSSSEPGRNHVMIPAEFERFWQRVIAAQGGDPVRQFPAPIERSMNSNATEANQLPSLRPELPPLHADDHGAIRVGNSRVLLELVIRAFQDGAVPETIVQRYSTLTLPEVYAVIAYYLRHTPEVESYLAHRERKAEEIRRRIESQQRDLTEIRARLLAHR